ncbi:uncharacterized protein BO80DRAFT_455699 [Aspergillus ibericus CBS 121593]|uniref:Protein kinase domain-containing protein n=1 Tax=Aspergillus ibericus CBS 121593 TaxID=1448316 RepID=A0A395GY32_9EURO|nr:hypothetical protein BO80DRAFT_455699 [Aspergillus ibericus CBS 121593]RAL00467.1 hypothetical protein BO80DRAFT_455699 [Aspergillus ibericus CBS 121593]
MSSQDSAWSLRELFFHRYDKTVEITIISKGNCFEIEIAPANFSNSPSALETYTDLINSMCDEEDYHLTQEAEEDLYIWALGPFLPIFADFDPNPVNPHPFTLRDYLHPQIYRYSLFIINERLEPRLDHTVPNQLLPSGVDLGNFALHPTWHKMKPENIQLPGTDYNELYSRPPNKVIADNTNCFLKRLESGDRRAATRELGVYKQIETLGLPNRIQVPRVVGVVEDEEEESRITGILLTWVQCGYRTLHCALKPETSLDLRKRWDTQVTSTVDCLHEAGIIWGDVKADNVLIDHEDNAWKSRMETVEGDEEGLAQLKEFLYLGKTF